MSAPANNVETPSGKGAQDENFPVGSFLLPKHLRPHVEVYYGFARAIDDIADNPDLEPDDKVERLKAMDLALIAEAGVGDPTFDKAHRLRQSLLETGVDFAHARDLVSAFKQDAVKNRYENWAELIDYCNRSAAPVGRYLLELHGEDREAFAWSDPLCNALQVLNHLQDCADDYRQLNRVYLPGDWMQEEGTTVEDLAQPSASRQLLRVIRRCVGQTRVLMADARLLPRNLYNRRLAMEAAVIVRIATALTTKLSHKDPVATRVELSKPEFILCGARGIVFGLLT
ncbi:MAG: squalene synthase HpnC [Aestuariivirgaceae bacterium]